MKNVYKKYERIIGERKWAEQKPNGDEKFLNIDGKKVPRDLKDRGSGWFSLGDMKSGSDPFGFGEMIKKREAELEKKREATRKWWDDDDEDDDDTS